MKILSHLALLCLGNLSVVLSAVVKFSDFTAFYDAIVIEARKLGIPEPERLPLGNKGSLPDDVNYRRTVTPKYAHGGISAKNNFANTPASIHFRLDPKDETASWYVEIEMNYATSRINGLVARNGSTVKFYSSSKHLVFYDI